MKQDMARARDFESKAMPHLERLYCTAIYMLGNESEAQDLVQESLATAYRFWDKHHFSPNHRVWLFRIVANSLKNRIRPLSGSPATTDGSDENDRNTANSRLMDHLPIDDSEHVPSSAISKNDVKEAIGNLPDTFRLIVVLSLLEGFSYREVADIVGLDLETVKSRLHQGRKLMQRGLLDQTTNSSTSSVIEDRVRSRRTG